MGLFSRKKKSVDYDALLKTHYQELNKLSMQAQQERDELIKMSLWQQVVDHYDDILDCIDHGAQGDRHHFEALKAHALHEAEMARKFYEDLQH